jgi:hypothetical protein
MNTTQKLLLTLSPIVAATALLASGSDAAIRMATPDSYKQCSEGASAFDWAFGRMWTCFTKPEEFKIKVYKVTLIKSDDTEVEIYNNDSPEFIDIVTGEKSIIDSVQTIGPGTYKEIRMVVDTIYMVKIDQTIKDIYGEWRVRSVGDRLAKDANFVIEPTSSSGNGNTSYSANNSASDIPGAVFAVNLDKPAAAVPYRHGSFLALPSNAITENKDYPCYYNGSRGGGYPMKVAYSYTTGPVETLTHSIDRDVSNFPIALNPTYGCPYIKPLNCSDITGQQCSSFSNPYTDARRATIASKLRTPITIDSAKSQAVTLTWDLTKAVGLVLNPISNNALTLLKNNAPSHEITMMTIADMQFSISVLEGTTSESVP